MEDLIIRGGTIIDGTGSPRYKADVAIKDGVITAIGDLSDDAAKNILDASGLIVAPGFIDSHAHSDTCFLNDTSCASKLFQGITTEISGQCGSSPFPRKSETVKKSPAALPLVTLWTNLNGVIMQWRSTKQCWWGMALCVPQ